MSKLNSVKFPGLPNAYTIPQDGTQLNVDNTAQTPKTIAEALNLLNSDKLDKQGAAADAGKALIADSTGLFTPTVLSQEVFVAEYKVTSYNDILSAYMAGKLIAIIDYTNKIIYRVDSINNANQILFSSGWSVNTSIAAGYVTSTNFWYRAAITPEDRSRKVNSLSSTSDISQYPSAKCVYDELYGGRIWTGTQAEYDAIAIKSSTTLYFIVEETA